jgi:hypothetical protein
MSLRELQSIGFYLLMATSVLASPAGANLSTTFSWSAHGGQAYCEFGGGLAPAGDVNGDGYGDVIVGAPGYDNGEVDEGRAYCYLGSPSGVSGVPAWMVEGNQAGAGFGYAVSTAGDVNGDGYDDVIVGACNFSDGQTGEGRACVYLGSVSGLNSAYAWQAESNQAGAHFGATVAAAGDVNGDGYDDVAVGAPYWHEGSAPDVGKVYLYLGSPSGLSPTPAWTAIGYEPYSYSATGLYSAGDVNADGYADLIVGAPWTSNGYGWAFLYLGSPSGLSSTPAWGRQGEQSLGLFGCSVAGAGDVNGDGYGDVMIGSRWHDFGEVDDGRAYLFLGNASGLEYDYSWAEGGYQAGAEFGMNVAPAGDVDGDGFSDVVIGAWKHDDGGNEDSGRAYVFRGSPYGLEDTASWIASGDQSFCGFGGWVATAGDVNGDGFSDVVISASDYSGTQTEEGRVFIYHGAGSPPSDAIAWGAFDTQEGAGFGESLSIAADVNGDGYSDILVGAPRFTGGEDHQGRVSLYLGTVEGIQELPSWTAEGDGYEYYFGQSVAAAGDVDGDGYSDVIVGAPFAEAAGIAYLYSGSASSLSTSPVWQTSANQDGAASGECVAGAGDVNADGYADVLVSTPGWDSELDGVGRVDLYLGSAGGLSDSPAWTVRGRVAGEALGRSVAAAGDVDGDGYGDVVVGSPLYTNGQLYEGRVQFFRGCSSGLSTTHSWEFESDCPGAFLGTSVTGVGDVDGDRYGDILIGAPAYYAPGGDERVGMAILFHGSGVGPLYLWMCRGDSVNARFGQSVAGIGDCDGDGYSDIAVGTPGGGSVPRGRVYLWRGSPSGPVTPSEGPLTLLATEEYDQFGRALSGGGDVNGDGFGDILVGSPTYSVSGAGGLAGLYQGNGGHGLFRLPRQVRRNTDDPIALLGRTDAEDSFRLNVMARSAAGRTKVRLQWEVKPYGVPFNGSGLGQTAFTMTMPPVDDGGSYAPMFGTVPGLAPNQAYHWRLRIASKSPYFPRTPWFSLQGNGVEETDLATPRALAVVEPDPSAVTSGLFLGPCAPNPSGPRTAISYSLPQSGRARIELFDIAGRRVAGIADAVQDPGPHITFWDRRGIVGARLPAGTYFVRLSFGSESRTRKVTLVE